MWDVPTCGKAAPGHDQLSPSIHLQPCLDLLSAWQPFSQHQADKQILPSLLLSLQYKTSCGWILGGVVSLEGNLRVAAAFCPSHGSHVRGKGPAMPGDDVELESSANYGSTAGEF